jgi:speckle-type POZ protein
MASSSTSSRCLTASVTGTHNLEVTSYSLLEGMGVGKFVSSTTFSVAGYDWNLRFYPDGITDNDRKEGYGAIWMLASVYQNSIAKVWHATIYVAKKFLATS